MSYDLRIWSVRPTVPPSDSAWRTRDSATIHEARGWQIVIGSAVPVEAEDVPPEIAAQLPGIGFLTELSMEPSAAPASALRLLRRVAGELATSAHGVIEDPQAETVARGRSVVRYAPIPRQPARDRLVFSWWFLGGPLLASDGATRLFTLLDREFPEALPWRYGLYEPLSFRWDREGRAACEEFFRQHYKNGGVFWQPRAPCVSVRYIVPEPLGPSWQGFRAGHLSIEVDHAVLQQPGWETMVRRVWRAVTALTQPFYGDVRRLRGQPPAEISLTPFTEEHPIQSWWWDGLPTSAATAVVIAAPYEALWPAFLDGAIATDGCWFREAESWASGDLCLIPAPPVDASQIEPSAWPPRESSSRKYPARWPFAAPRTGSS